MNTHKRQIRGDLIHITVSIHHSTIILSTMQWGGRVYRLTSAGSLLLPSPEKHHLVLNSVGWESRPAHISQDSPFIITRKPSSCAQLSGVGESTGSHQPGLSFYHHQKTIILCSTQWGGRVDWLTSARILHIPWYHKCTMQRVEESISCFKRFRKRIFSFNKQ